MLIEKISTLPAPGGLGIFSPLLIAAGCWVCYGLLAMGNGHAPGTATGRGIAGAGVAITGFGAMRRWIAGLAVFFFAAFLIAGFLAGFFLAGFVLTPGFFFAGFRATAFFPPADFRVAARLADFGADFFFAAFFVAFFAAFFTFAMTASDADHE